LESYEMSYSKKISLLYWLDSHFSKWRETNGALETPLKIFSVCLEGDLGDKNPYYLNIKRS
jgi:hypothetical protein